MAALDNFLLGVRNIPSSYIHIMLRSLLLMCDTKRNEEMEASDCSNFNLDQDLNIETECREDYDYDDEEIQKDAANEVVAFMVYVALAFFLSLFLGTMIFCVFIVGKYGFVTFILVLSVTILVLAICSFVSRLIDDDQVLNPVRRKIRRIHAVATAVIVKELKDFQLDVQNHLLVTYENPHNTHESDISMPQKRRRHRSRMFRLMIKPFLKKKKGSRIIRFGRKKNAGTNESIDL